MTIALLKEATVAVEWTITIQGKNEFGDVCRREVRVDKSWERLFDGEVGLSIEAGKKIMAALQGAIVSHEAETYSLFRRVCPDCHTFRPVKDYTKRRIRTVFGTVEVRNPRWVLCPDCHPGIAGAFAPLKEICPDRATPELMELTARLGSMMPYRQAATVLAEFLPVEPTETHATVRKRTIRIGERLDDQIAQEERRARSHQTEERRQLECSFPVTDARSSSSASTRLISAVPIPIQRGTSSSLWPDAAAAVGVMSVVAISRRAAPTKPQSGIEPCMPFDRKGIAVSATSP